MKLIIYGGEDLRLPGYRLGSEGDDYAAIIDAFFPVLSRLGDTTRVEHLDEVERVRAACELSGDTCVILSFVQPHKTTLFMRVPLIPVFAWGFENIPCEIWDGQPKHDWRSILQQQGKAITLSRHSADVVRATMGDMFPVVGIAPPIFDRMRTLRERIGGLPPSARRIDLPAAMIDRSTLTGPPVPPERAAPIETVLDVPIDKDHDDNTGSENVVLPAASLQQPVLVGSTTSVTIRRRRGRIISVYREHIRPLVPPPIARAISWAGTAAWAVTHPFRSETAQAPASQQIDVLSRMPVPLPLARATFIDGLDPPSLGPLSWVDRRPIDWARHPVDLNGVIYLATGVLAGGTNLEDILTGFVWGLPEASDAILVVRSVSREPSRHWEDVRSILQRQPAFSGRVLLVDGVLTADELSALVESASYVVNGGSAEGCAYDLLESMSAGRPAIAPSHAAMTDIINSSNAFVFQSHAEAAVFPHDGRRASRTLWHLPRWDSLRDAFRESYAVAKDDPARWLAMSRAAVTAQECYCGDDVVEHRLRSFLGVSSERPSLTRWGRDLSAILSPADEVLAEEPWI